MTFPSLPGPVVGQIDSEDAYRPISQNGVVGVEGLPACERIMLGNGRELTLWYGGGYDDVPCYWTIDDPPGWPVPKRGA